MKLIVSAALPRRLFPPCSSSSWGWGVSSSPIHTTKKTTIRMRAIPARDLVIDFGKHKGKMLGTLSSEYLRWMSKNLKTGDFEKWGKLAEDVLEDEVYNDRMEWEVAERLLTGEGMEGSSGCGVATQLEETSKRFGWDYNDKVGWSKVDFGLLGTSKGGRLPRIDGKKQQNDEDEINNFRKAAGKGCSGGVGRERRGERAAKKREKQITVNRIESNEEEDMNNNNGRKEEDKISLRFPGRQSLVNRMLMKKQIREIGR